MTVTRIPYWLLRGLATLTFLACFACVAIAFIAMAIWLIIAPLVPPDSVVWSEARCHAGYPPENYKCRSEIEFERRLKRIAKASKAKADEDLQKRLARIAKIEKRYKNITVFAEGFAEGQQISTGVRYEDLSKTTRWKRAWCTTEINHNGVAVSITLATLEPGPDLVRITKYTAEELAVIGARSVDKMYAECKWPDMAQGA